jgi:hypothetical protein
MPVVVEKTWQPTMRWCAFTDTATSPQFRKTQFSTLPISAVVRFKPDAVPAPVFETRFTKHSLTTPPPDIPVVEKLVAPLMPSTLQATTASVPEIPATDPDDAPWLREPTRQ